MSSIDKFDIEGLRSGDKLYIKDEIIHSSGQVMFEKDQQVTVREVEVKKGFWSKVCSDIYHKPEITGIKLVDHYGIWRLDTFYKGE